VAFFSSKPGIKALRELLGQQVRLQEQQRVLLERQVQQELRERLQAQPGQRQVQERQQELLLSYRKRPEQQQRSALP